MAEKMGGSCCEQCKKVMPGSPKPATANTSGGPAPAKNSVGGSGSGLFNPPKMGGKGK